MDPKHAKWLPVRWLTLVTALLLLVSGLAFTTVRPLSAQTVTTIGGAPDTAVPSPTNTATPTMTPTIIATSPAATDAATPSASVAPSGNVAPSNATTTTSTTPTASDAPVTTSSPDVDYNEGHDNGGPKNIVTVINKNDNRLRVKGKIQLNHIPGNDAEPENDAEAYGSCANCATFAIALQIDLISRTASIIAPKNAAIALNVQCSHCTTVSRAVQYVVQVDDPTQTPDNVKNLIRQMQKELDAAAHDKDATVGQVESQINTVISQFSELGNSLYNQRDEKNDENDPGATAPPDAVVLTPTTTP